MHNYHVIMHNYRVIMHNYRVIMQNYCVIMHNYEFFGIPGNFHVISEAKIS